MKKFFIIRAMVFIGLVSFPLFAGAVDKTSALQGIGTIGDIINTFTSSVVKALAVLCLTAAVTVFFFGIVEYIWGIRNADPNKTKAGNMFMVWGLVALFVMFSVWGIVRFAQGIFNIQNDNNITIPQIDFIKSGGGTNGSVNQQGGAFCSLLADGTPCSSGGTCRGGQCITPNQGDGTTGGTTGGNFCAGKPLDTPCPLGGGYGKCGNSTTRYECLGPITGTTGTAGTTGANDGNGWCNNSTFGQTCPGGGVCQHDPTSELGAYICQTGTTGGSQTGAAATGGSQTGTVGSSGECDASTLGQSCPGGTCKQNQESGDYYCN